MTKKVFNFDIFSLLHNILVIGAERVSEIRFSSIVEKWEDEK